MGPHVSAAPVPRVAPMPAADRGTQATYDAVAADYARLLPDLSVEAPLDRAVLVCFADLVEELGGGLVADVGCGSGRVTAHLAERDLRVVGVDLSPGMLTQARRAHPHLALAVAHAAALPVRSGVLAGLVAWYSLIHLPGDRLAGVFAEFARVTTRGAPVLVAFQCGEGQRVERLTSFGPPSPLTSYRHRIDDVAGALDAAGFAPYATVRREPALAHETTPQAFLLAQRR